VILLLLAGVSLLVLPARDQDLARARQIGGTITVKSAAAAINDAGRADATGIFESPADFDSEPGVLAGQRDIFISKLGSAGILTPTSAPTADPMHFARP
jgi:hypothetical protein